MICRMGMRDYGNFLSEGLRMSSDKVMKELGEKFDLFPLECSHHTGFYMATNNTHAFTELASFIINKRFEYNFVDQLYTMKEQVILIKSTRNLS